MHHKPTDEEIARRLEGILGDGFNRAIGALVQAGAIDTRKMNKQYKGAGSKFYDLVTEQTVITARYGAPTLRRLFEEEDTR